MYDASMAQALEFTVPTWIYLELFGRS